MTPHSTLTLDRALDLTRTGDVWLFRGRSGADRAIRSLTNAPVNHVGMAIVVDDLPPLMWHAELGRALPDLWAGRHQRGVQLHDLRDAVLQWGHHYGQRAWLRQLEGELTREMEDAALRTVARLDGTPFPSTARLAGRWLRGRAPQAQDTVRRVRRSGGSVLGRLRALAGRGPVEEHPDDHTDADGVPAEVGSALATAYCAEVVAVTYEEMRLLPDANRPNWYDPGRFWSGDELFLAPGYSLGGEIAVTLPPAGAPRRR
ncbi:MAG: hypothetical protein OJJ54_00075 [Pseudonocardia sp.]|nr:hypothetical protein [Pseudonocardia sp.]